MSIRQNFTLLLTLFIADRDRAGRGLDVIPRLEGLFLLIHFIVMRLFIHCDGFVCRGEGEQGRMEEEIDESLGGSDD